MISPSLALPPILLAAGTHQPGTRRLGWAGGLCLLAKLAEAGDHVVFNLTAELVNGHTLKHLVAVLAIDQLRQMYVDRQWMGDNRAPSIKTA